MTTAEAAYEAYRAALGLPGTFFSLTSNERDAWEDVVEAVKEIEDFEDSTFRAYGHVPCQCSSCKEERNG